MAHLRVVENGFEFGLGEHGGLDHDEVKIVLRLGVFERRLGFVEEQGFKLLALVVGEGDRALEGLNRQVDFGFVDEFFALGLVELVGGPLVGQRECS